MRPKDLMMWEFLKKKKLKMRSCLLMKMIKAITREELLTLNRKMMWTSPTLMRKKIDLECRKVLWTVIFLTQNESSTRDMQQRVKTQSRIGRKILKKSLRSMMKSVNFTRKTQERQKNAISTKINGKMTFLQTKLKIQRKFNNQNLQKIRTCLLLKRLSNRRWTKE